MNREKDTAANAEWQDYGTAPKDGTRFLALWTKGMRHEYGVISWNKRRDGWLEGYNETVGEFEHWMPLPALTVNTSTPGNDLEYNGLAASRDLERRVLKLELTVSALMEK